MSASPPSPPDRPTSQALEAYFEYALTGILEADADGRVVRGNPAAASILGRSRRRLCGAMLVDLLGGQDAARRRLARHQETVLEQGVSLATISACIDDRERAIELASIDLGEGRFLHILDDITDQRQLTESLEAARRAADEANAAKSAFLANISHEIRTPLNGIIGIERLLRLTPLTPQQSGYLDDLQRAAQTLHALLGGVLDLARIEAGRLDVDVRAFDADEFLETVATACGPVAAAKPIRLIFEVDPDAPRQWRGDPLRLAQAVNNLLANAIKFTLTGRVVLAVSWSAADGGWLRLAVSDTGIGMSEEQLHRVFAPFVQADPSVTRRYGGSGLGLAIARGIADAMGGRITATSRPGKGSEFVLEVPMAASATTVIHPGESRAAVVARDVQLGRAVARLLAREGVNAETVAAEDVARQLRPGMLLVIDDELAAEVGERLSSAVAPKGWVLMQSRPWMEWRAPTPGAVTMRLPATPLRVRNAIAECRGARPASLAPSWASMRGEYAGCSVMLVEDDPISRRTTAELLRFAGIGVTTCENGAEACAALQAPSGHAIQMVLMDVQMPVMDGLSATRVLRAAGVAVPIVALTSGTSAEEREACAEAGMNDWMSKPIDLDDFEAVLARWLTARRAPDPQPDPVPSSAAAASGSTHTVLDEAGALGRFLGNRAAYAAALHEFVEREARPIAQLEEHLGAGDRETVARESHRIAGTAALLGADVLSAAARDLERAARSPAVDATAGAARLRAAFAQLAQSVLRLGG